MSRHGDSILREMGFSPLWKLRGRENEQPNKEPLSPASAQHSDTKLIEAPQPPPTRTEQTASTVGTMDWETLEREIRECRRCVLCQARKQAVPGVGDRNANWMFIGEGPGRDEDAQGEPFVGQAGKLLDNMLAAIGLKRGNNVYIANAVKCRPPHNRTPVTEEIAACLPFLERQIELVKPRLLIALGRPAAQSLLDMEVRIGAARGRLFNYTDIPVIVTYHPAYLLRNLPDKAKAWEDLCFALKTMEGFEGTG